MTFTITDLRLLRHLVGRSVAMYEMSTHDAVTGLCACDGTTLHGCDSEPWIDVLTDLELHGLVTSRVGRGGMRLWRVTMLGHRVARTNARPVVVDAAL